jgi:DnaJ family protein C protein 7
MDSYNFDEIRKAYKKLALKWHPDRNSESEESQKMAEKMFRDINDAYSVLSDPKKKQMYDSGCDPLNPEENSGMGEGGMHFSGDPSEIFKVFFGGSGGGPESK